MSNSIASQGLKSMLIEAEINLDDDESDKNDDCIDDNNNDYDENDEGEGEDEGEDKNLEIHDIIDLEYIFFGRRYSNVQRQVTEW